MSFLRTERLAGFIPQLPLIPFAKPVNEDAILDVEDPALNRFNQVRAKEIALQVKARGSARFPLGPWTEHDVPLPRNRIAYLQASRDGALVINIPATPQDILDIHARSDDGDLTSLQVWDPKRNQSVRHYDFSYAVPSVPPSFRRWYALRMFSAILHLIGQGIYKS